jgi:hypothetical protein
MRLKKDETGQVLCRDEDVTREEQEELLHLYQVLDVSGALADCVEHGSHGEGTANDDAEGAQVALVGSDEDVPEETESEEREVHEGDDCDARGLGVHVSLLRFFGRLFLPDDSTLPQLRADVSSSSENF